MEPSAIFLSLSQGPSDGSSQPVVSRAQLLRILRSAGLQRDDPRLRETMQILMDDTYAFMDITKFQAVMEPCALLIGKALSGQLIIPDFASFQAEMGTIFEHARANTSGHVASYIPELATVDPALYGAAVCTVDGQSASFGDQDKLFCVQSCCKPILYMLALKVHGLHLTHRFLGREPSGGRFNKLELKEVPAGMPAAAAVPDIDMDGTDSPLAGLPMPAAVPHNPMINSGAIMSSALYLAHHQAGNPATFMAAAVRESLDLWQRMTLGNVSVNVSVFLSERSTSDRNKCLAYMMRESQAFPSSVPVYEALDFYFQMCSVQTTVRDMSVLAATLANGGVNPTTDERVLDAMTVRHCLSLMTSCGMYDYSGEWAFNIGLPAKSGVGGCVFVVVPNVCGFAVWSPRLDAVGNSTRAVEFFTTLTHHYSFHSLDQLNGVRAERHAVDPTERPHASHDTTATMMLYAAARGDVHGIKALVASGADVNCCDYDMRYPLHVAASEGQAATVRFLLSHGADPDVKDRWDHSPLMDAQLAGFDAIVALIQGDKDVLKMTDRSELECSGEPGDAPSMQTPMPANINTP